MCQVFTYCIYFFKQQSVINIAKNELPDLFASKETADTLHGCVNRWM